MEDGLEGRLDGERPEALGARLDKTASLWAELAQLEPTNIFINIGFGDYDTDLDRDFVSFKSSRLKNQYGFVGPSDILTMLNKYHKDLQSELARIIIPRLSEESYGVFNALKFSKIETPLDGAITLDESNNTFRMDFDCILDYFEIRPNQLHGQNLQEIALRTYISYGRELLRGDIPAPTYSLPGFSQPKKAPKTTKEEPKKPRSKSASSQENKE